MRIALLLAFALSTALAAAEGRTYYADPAKGSLENDGSAAKPWPALAETAQAGKLSACKAGDSLLLRSGKHNVTEAALEVGYNSLSHFSHAFHQQFGCCPGLYPVSVKALRGDP